MAGYGKTGFAPEQALMEGGTASLESVFGPRESFLVKQTARGWMRECCGCEAKSEYKISAMDFQYLQSGGWLSEGVSSLPDELYALEESGCCMRLCWRDGRAMDMGVSLGGEQGGPDVVRYSKPCGCPLNLAIPIDEGSVTVPCCFALPELSTMTPDGKELNKSAYICDMYCCVPKFGYYENEEEVYRLKPMTCCGGCCPMIQCKRTPSVPFYFHDPESGEVLSDGAVDEESYPQIIKVWTGMVKESCTTADTFAIFFPQGCSAERKAGLLGLTFLLDFTVFERQGEATVAGSAF